MSHLRNFPCLSLGEEGAIAHQCGDPQWGSGRPVVIENDELISLYFDPTGIQSAMLVADPYALALGYTRTMAGFFLFQPSPRRISMIGLGGGSLAKYCHRHAPLTRIVVVEINHEIIALRHRFFIPPDDERFSIVYGNGASYMKRRDERPDVILVDGFTADGQALELADVGFYADAHARLSDDGIFVTNLITDDWNFCENLIAMKRVFGERLALARSEDSPLNVTVFGWKDKRTVASVEWLRQRAIRLSSSHPIDFHETVKRIEYGKAFEWSLF